MPPAAQAFFEFFVRADHYVNQKAQKMIPLPPGRGITPYRITQSASTSAMKAWMASSGTSFLLRTRFTMSPTVFL